MPKVSPLYLTTSKTASFRGNDNIRSGKASVRSADGFISFAGPKETNQRKGPSPTKQTGHRIGCGDFPTRHPWLGRKTMHILCIALRVCVDFSRSKLLTCLIAFRKKWGDLRHKAHPARFPCMCGSGASRDGGGNGAGRLSEMTGADASCFSGVECGGGLGCCRPEVGVDSEAPASQPV
jgi:hypothetical protein